MPLGRKKKPLARGIETPVVADAVAWPEVVYSQDLTIIEFPTEDEAGWGRVTFESLDALRVARGEHTLYDDDWKEGGPWHWVFAVENSDWLIERHAYETKFYRNAYEFGGDVDEMLRDYQHYLFRFHDQSVEAIAAGIWFEESETRFDRTTIPPSHPLVDFDEAETQETFTVKGYRCHVRVNPKPMDQLIGLDLLP